MIPFTIDMIATSNNPSPIILPIHASTTVVWRPVHLFTAGAVYSALLGSSRISSTTAQIIINPIKMLNMFTPLRKNPHKPTIQAYRNTDYDRKKQCVSNPTGYRTHE